MNSKLALVFLPGVGFSKTLWRKVTPLLANLDCDIITPDLPYYGSKYGHEKLTFDNYLFLLHDLWGQEGLADRNVVLIGHSFGAYVALRYTSLFQERVKGLVLISAPFVTNEKQIPRKLAFIIKLGYHSKILSETIRVLAVKTDTILRVVFHKPNTLKGLCSPRAFWKKGKVWNIAYCFHDIFFKENFVEEISRVTIPVLLPYGLKDNWFFLIDGTSAYRYFAQKREVPIDSNHSVPVYQPEILVTEIKKYLADLQLA